MPTTTDSSASVRRVRRTLDDADASLVGRRVLALCSGGADSVALVALLGALQRGAAPKAIEVLWVEHGIRDDTSEERVAAAAAAASIGATFHARVASQPGIAAPSNAEALFRELRYDLAAHLAAERDLDVICTGHSASDQLEQALLSLIGVTGRSGGVDAMPVVRDLASGLQLVRPLLALTREQLEQACRDAGLAWGLDPTNEDPDYTRRNAVRHRVVPALLSVREDAGVDIARAGRRQRHLDTVTATLAAALLHEWAPDDLRCIDVRRLATFDVATRRELIAA